MSKVEVDLKTFLISGQFGSIMLGLSRSQIVKLLGWPDAWLPKTKLTAYLWAYEWIEFYFDMEDRLCLIRCDYMDALEGNERFTFQPRILNPHLSLEAAERTFIDENIPFQRIDNPKFEISQLILQSGVELSFEPDDDLPLGRYLSAFHYRNPLSNPAW
jgi:hypothetical protein